MGSHEFAEFWPQATAPAIFYPQPHPMNNINNMGQMSFPGHHPPTDAIAHQADPPRSVHAEMMRNGEAESHAADQQGLLSLGEGQQLNTSSIQVVGMNAASSAAQLLAGIQNNNLNGFQHSGLPPSFVHFGLQAAAAAACAKSDYSDGSQAHEQVITSPVAMLDFDNSHQFRPPDPMEPNGQFSQNELDLLIHNQQQIQRSLADLPPLSQSSHLRPSNPPADGMNNQNALNVHVGHPHHQKVPPSSSSENPANSHLMNPLIPFMNSDLNEHQDLSQLSNNNGFESQPCSLDFVLGSQQRHQMQTLKVEPGVPRLGDEMHLNAQVKKEKNGSEAAVKHSNPPVCRVCLSGPSNGLHFGAPRTCAACAAFFRRTVSDQKKYVCKRPQRCTLRYSEATGYRKICRNCRMKRCLEIGMMPDKVQHKRNRRDYVEFPRSATKTESAEPQVTLAELSDQYNALQPEHLVAANHSQHNEFPPLLPPNPWAFPPMGLSRL